MLSIHESHNLEEAGAELLAFILEPSHWVMLDQLRVNPSARPGQNPDYQRQVGPLQICASIDVSPAHDAFLRVAFRAPGLTPLSASDHLDAFLRSRLPLLPNTEWQVEIDSRRWIHFIRRYAGVGLAA